MFSILPQKAAQILKAKAQRLLVAGAGREAGAVDEPFQIRHGQRIVFHKAAAGTGLFHQRSEVGHGFSSWRRTSRPPVAVESVLEHFLFETPCVSNHTPCRFTEKRCFPVRLWQGGAKGGGNQPFRSS